MKRMMKRFAAGAFAATLALTSANITALAAGETTVTVTGDVNYVDMSTYTQVILPTTKTLQFALDPQGLSAMTGTSATAAELAASAGKIVSNGEASIINWGYYPIKASAKFYVTDNGGSEFVDTAAGIDADTSKKIYLTATPSSAATTVTTTNDADGKIEDITTAGYAAAAEGVAITSKAAASANGMVFALEGAEYTFTKETDADGNDSYSAERNPSGTYGVASFKIGGELNKNADWSAYSTAKPKTLKLNAVFSFTSITPDTLKYYKDSFIQSGTYNMIASNAPGVTDPDATVYYDPSNGGRVQLTVGTGAAESTIRTVQFVKTTVKTKTIDSTETTSTSNIGVSKYTLNATGTELTLPSVSGVLKDVDKVDTTDTNNFDSASSTYTKVAYADATYSYEISYKLNVIYADGTSFELPVTIIKAQAPTVTYTGNALAGKKAATANAAIKVSDVSVTLGNTGATKITNVAINESKSTKVTLSAIADNKVTHTDTTITIAASAFKYLNTDAGQIVYTVTFDNGQTVDLVIPVAAP